MRSGSTDIEGQKAIIMNDVLKIYFAIFCAGAVSLILELSLLREYVYVFGSTATSNAMVISLFLTGMVIGSYVGTWNRLKSADEIATSRKFVIAQLVNIVFWRSSTRRRGISFITVRTKT